MLAPTQINSRIATVVLTMTASIVFSSEALAAGPQCAALFETETRAYRESENYRVELLGKAKELLKLVRTARMDGTILFQLQLERRDEVSFSRINRSLESSSTLAEIRMQPTERASVITVLPPKIAPSTVELMQDPRVDLGVVAARLAADPYFAWLKHNALRYEASQKDDLKAIHRFQKPPIDQANPILLFVSYRKEGMSPDMALIRVMRNLDPVLSPSAVYAAGGALFHSALEAVLNEKVIPNLTSRKSTRRDDAWLLMPTQKDGAQNFRKLLDEQRAYHGVIFPRAAYERILILADNHNPVLSVMKEYRIRRYQGVPEAKIIAELNPHLMALQTRLGLPGDFPIARLYDVVDRVYSLRSLSSYEQILADVFDPATGAKLRDLRMLTELADGLSTRERADAYLRSLVEP